MVYLNINFYCVCFLLVLPQLELHPSTAETGVHTHETIRLCCVGSGFPRPELEWSPSEGFKQGRTYLDAYTVSTELVIENALPSMSGKYTCGARVFDGNCIRQDGECSFTDKRTTTLHTKLFIYGMYQYIFYAVDRWHGMNVLP